MGPSHYVLLASGLLQLVAAILAVRLIRITGFRSAWLLIATATSLMAVRRFLTFTRALADPTRRSPDLQTELVAFLISALMVAGVAGILPVLRSLYRAEDRVRHVQKLEAVGRLAGGVAHDFNNLLQAMQSVTDLLQLGMRDTALVKNKSKELAELIRRGSQLTRQLLLFSRRETAKMEVIDLRESIEGAMRLLRHLLRENVAFEVDLAVEELPVRVDRGQIEQVVVNLALNSAEAMPSGGTLTLRAYGHQQLWAVLEIADTGEGICDEIGDRIFEPFFTTKEREKGTGLGLSVVHGIAKEHGGRVTFESEVGKGTVFKVWLPMISGEASA